MRPDLKPCPDRAAIWVVVLAVTLVAPLAAADTDTDALLALHVKAIRAHQESNIDLLLQDETDDYVVANRGEVTRPTLAERRARLGGYLRRTRFEEYRDVREPIVEVSKDGTLGWVVVQVHARGVQTGPDGARTPIEFTSAWIELYRKREGRWLRVGNVSNFKE